MKIKTTVTIDKTDINTLLAAANILEVLSNKSVCWTADQIRDFIKEKPSSRWDINIEWKKEEN